MITRRDGLKGLMAGGLTAIAGGASAQSFPSRTITMIIGFSAGGPADTTGRILAEGMRAPLGQTVVVENVTGAGGTLASARVVRATPDGYTINYGSVTTHVFNGALYTLPFDLVEDFEPVALVNTQPLLIIARKDMPGSDLKEMVAWLKANPGKASGGSSGNGSAPHVYGLLFQKETDTRYQFVPYRGTAPAMQGLLSGQIDLLTDLAANSLPQVRNGNVKAYAVTSKTRMAAAPDIPTVGEMGFPSLEFSLWQAVWAPKGTPKDVIARLNASVMDALKDPAVRSRFADLGQEIPPPNDQAPEALGAFHRAEVAKWVPIIRAAQVKAE